MFSFVLNTMEKKGGPHLLEKVALAWEMRLSRSSS